MKRSMVPHAAAPAFMLLLVGLFPPAHAEASCEPTISEAIPMPFMITIIGAMFIGSLVK